LYLKKNPEKYFPLAVKAVTLSFFNRQGAPQVCFKNFATRILALTATCQNKELPQYLIIYQRLL